MLRRLEGWLHQHIFKVGWLLTKNFQTTTILYYTFFLPGVVLYEVVYWLAAGVLNVRADRALAWPEKQEVAELRLNFVKLSKKAGRIRLAIISVVPLVTGLGIAFLIARDVLRVPAFLTVLAAGNFDLIWPALTTLVSAPDFWLWVYLIFAISNTMMPNPKDLQGWWLIAGLVVAVFFVLFLLGAGDIVLTNLVSGPIFTVLNTLSGIFAVIIAVDLVMVAFLGTFESIIERITGDSATFKDGKLIAITRAELLAQREQQLKRERQQAKKPAPALPAGPPSIYNLPLPLPGAPGKEPVTQLPSVVLGADVVSPPLTLRERPVPPLIRPAGDEPNLPRPAMPQSERLSPAAARPSGNEPSTNAPSGKLPLPNTPLAPARPQPLLSPPADSDETGDEP
ncbi:MAG: hypothetical protein HXY40_06805 [Chloroflexi bacterium]|nr:hypothetical protein [Chloroflexota bacterium]